MHELLAKSTKRSTRTVLWLKYERFESLLAHVAMTHTHNLERLGTVWPYILY